MSRFNAWLATRITEAVGTMYCAYFFAVLALLGFDGSSPAAFVRWFSTTFLQLVMLSIILVSQSIQNAAADRREAMLMRMVDELCEHEGVCIPDEVEGTD